MWEGYSQCSGIIEQLACLFTCLAEHRTPLWPVPLQAVFPERRGRPVLKERGA